VRNCLKNIVKHHYLLSVSPSSSNDPTPGPSTSLVKGKNKFKSIFVTFGPLLLPFLSLFLIRVLPVSLSDETEATMAPLPTVAQELASLVAVNGDAVEDMARERNKEEEELMLKRLCTSRASC